MLMRYSKVNKSVCCGEFSQAALNQILHEDIGRIPFRLFNLANPHFYAHLHCHGFLTPRQRNLH